MSIWTMLVLSAITMVALILEATLLFAVKPGKDEGALWRLVILRTARR